MANIRENKRDGKAISYRFTPIGQYTSDNSGYVYIEGLTTSGRYYLRELENEGYVPDTQMKTVYVTAGETTLIERKNIPIERALACVSQLDCLH